MEPSKFDWANTYKNRLIVKIKTALGNTVIGRLDSYLIFTKLVGAYGQDWVVLKGFVTNNPNELKTYQCSPVSIELKEGTDGTQTASGSSPPGAP